MKNCYICEKDSLPQDLKLEPGQIVPVCLKHLKDPLEEKTYEQKFYKVRNLLREIRQITKCPEAANIVEHIRSLMSIVK